MKEKKFELQNINCIKLRYWITYNQMSIVGLDYNDKIIYEKTIKKNMSINYFPKIIEMVISDLITKIKLNKIELYVRGKHPQVEQMILALKNVGFEITKIKDETPIPHNGCRPPFSKRKKLVK